MKNNYTINRYILGIIFYAGAAVPGTTFFLPAFHIYTINYEY